MGRHCDFSEDRNKSPVYTKIITGLGFASCVIGWLGFFYIAPLTLLCGAFLVRRKKYMSGFTCLILGLIQLYLVIKPPISW